MALRKDACKSNPGNLVLPDGVSLCSARIFDHLTPKLQNLNPKMRNSNPITTLICCVKNSCVCLRKDWDSRVLKTKDIEDLHKLLQ